MVVLLLLSCWISHVATCSSDPSCSSWVRWTARSCDESTGRFDVQKTVKNYRVDTSCGWGINSCGCTFANASSSTNTKPCGEWSEWAQESCNLDLDTHVGTATWKRRCSGTTLAGCYPSDQTTVYRCVGGRAASSQTITGLCCDCSVSNCLTCKNDASVCESCEVGYRLSNGVCQPVCGDGYRTGIENCDDRNTNSGDGCSSDCSTKEDGWSCTPKGVSPTVCEAICGDGLVVGGEECDDGNTADGDGCNSSCQDESSQPCGTDCRRDSNLECVSTDGINHSCQCMQGHELVNGICTAKCGDGLLLLSEECDDGNTNSNDGCSNTCTLETGYTHCDTVTCTPHCGDWWTVGEECDDGNLADGDGCDSSCKIEVHAECVNNEDTSVGPTRPSSCKAWIPVTVNSNNTICHVLAQGDNTVGTTVTTDSIAFDVQSTENFATVMACDITLNQEFTAIRGTLKVRQTNTARPDNNHVIELWGDQMNANQQGGHIAVGTPDTIVYPGGDGWTQGEPTQEYTVSETTVSAGYVVRVSTEQTRDKEDFEMYDFSSSLYVLIGESTSTSSSSLVEHTSSNVSSGLDVPQRVLPKKRQHNNKLVLAFVAIVVGVVVGAVLVVAVVKNRRGSARLQDESSSSTALNALPAQTP
eukprot:TRINITY_DN49039_c0_g2_i1.p1 TRINITY_DN49039_c0_g2~~TRINITY_DN49039_c0_g2_i1.p1  ORF type:complete len:643 (-),score=55.44 TRINITY_DN49039_c0_g2_i1:954-2882(-)